MSDGEKQIFNVSCLAVKITINYLTTEQDFQTEEFLQFPNKNSVGPRVAQTAGYEIGSLERKASVLTT